MARLVDIFRHRVKEAMGDKSAYWLAKTANVAYSTVTRLLDGETDPTLSTVEKFAEALGVSPAELLGGQNWQDPLAEQLESVPRDILRMLPNQHAIVYDSIRTTLKHMQMARIEIEAELKSGGKKGQP
jgi:transcriptional regulator with XRE-family HTH domain